MMPPWPGLAIPDEIRQLLVTTFIANGRSSNDAVRLSDLSIHAAQRGMDSMETAINVADPSDALQVRITAWNMCVSYLGFQSKVLEKAMRARGICGDPIDVTVSVEPEIAHG